MTAEDLRWVSPRLDPVCLPPALALKGVSRVRRRGLPQLPGVRVPRPPSGARSGPPHRDDHLVPRPGAAVLPRARRRSRASGASALGPVSPAARPRDAASAARQLPRVGCRVLPELERGAVPRRRGLGRRRSRARAAERHRGRGLRRSGSTRRRFASCCSWGSGCRPRASATSSQAFADLAGREDVRLTCLGTGAPADVVTRGVSRGAARPRTRGAVGRAGAGLRRVAGGRPVRLPDAVGRVQQGAARSHGRRPAGGGHRRSARRPTSCSDGHNGLMVPPADAAAIASAVTPIPARPGDGRAPRRGGTGHRGSLPARGGVPAVGATALYGVVDRHARDARGMEKRRDVVL